MEVLYDDEIHHLYENDVHAFHGDRVIVCNEKRKILEIKERKVHKIAGVLLCDSKTKYGIHNSKTIYLCYPYDKRYPTFYLPSKYENETHKKYVYFQFVEWSKESKYPLGSVLDYIGNVGDKDAEYLYLRYVYDLHTVKECKMDKKKYEADKVIHDALQKKREDYQIYTIDPVGCKDIDDGFHFVEKGDGKMEVGIHISYVWKYFEKNPYYFDLFSQRVSTLYTHTKNIDMIPKEYSTHLGSLVEREKKCALSIVYQIEEYKIVSYEVKETVVYVVKNYDYESVDAILQKDDVASLSGKEKMLRGFRTLSQKLFQLASDSKSSASSSASRQDHLLEDSHKLVEYWMIYANSTMAYEAVQRFGTRALLRVQPKGCESDGNKKMIPLFENKAALYQFYQDEDEDKDKEINQHASICKEFSLPYYTHYTSPIRRFCDMYIHALFTNTLPQEAALSKSALSHMNDMGVRFRRYQNKSKILDLLYQHMEKYEYTLQSEGIVIEKYQTYIKVYFPSYGFMVNKHIELDVEDHNELYQSYPFELYLFPKKHLWSERIRIKRV